MTYGGVIAGSHWCTFTVHPTTVPRPDTSTTSISVESQYGHAGVGGKSSAPHGMLRCTRNAPSLPAVQKKSFSGVSSGSGRAGSDASVLVIGATLNAPRQVFDGKPRSMTLVAGSGQRDVTTLGRV